MRKEIVRVHDGVMRKEIVWEAGGAVVIYDGERIPLEGGTSHGEGLRKIVLGEGNRGRGVHAGPPLWEGGQIVKIVFRNSPHSRREEAARLLFEILNRITLESVGVEGRESILEAYASPRAREGSNLALQEAESAFSACIDTQPRDWWKWNCGHLREAHKQLNRVAGSQAAKDAVQQDLDDLAKREKREQTRPCGRAVVVLHLAVLWIRPDAHKLKTAKAINDQLEEQWPELLGEKTKRGSLRRFKNKALGEMREKNAPVHILNEIAGGECWLHEPFKRLSGAL